MLLLLSWPAFRYYFYAEAFWALRIYNQHGRRLWQAAFSKIDGMFFRPGFFLAHIAWIFILPSSPLTYHIRNFVFCAINVFLFYCVLLKLVRSRPARIIAIALFAASKIHLSIIGSINAYEASVLLMNELLTILFWVRYLQERRTLDYFLTFIFCALSVFSKDNGFMVIGIQASMVLAIAVKLPELKSQIKYWVVRLVPFVVLAASYLILRYILTGPLNPDNPVYSPRLSFLVAARQTTGFLATVGNFALTSPGSMGARGFSGVVAGNSKVVEFVLCAGLWLMIIYALWLARSSWQLLILPIVWIGSYLFPIFLIRNHQVYYYQEPLIGVALLIGICLDRANRSLLRIWVLVVALIAINGFISNRRSYYDWQYAANQAAMVKPLVETYKGKAPKLIVFISSRERRDFWVFAIGGPMVPYLLGSPNTRVEIVDKDSDELVNRQARAHGATLFFDIDQGLIEPRPSTQVAAADAAKGSPENSERATLKANPNPIPVCDNSGLGITTISYELAEQDSVEIHVDSPSGTLFAKPNASGSLTTGQWVTDGMVFFLQDVADGKPLTAENTIDKITLSLTKYGCQ